MHSQLFPSPLLQNPISTTFFFMLITLHTSQGQDYEQLSNCRFYLYNCGENIRNVGFPFWGANRPQHCGVSRFELTCQQDNHTTIDMDSHTFRVLSINRSSHAINIARTDLWENICTNNFNDTSLNETMFRYLPGGRQLNLYYGCASVSMVNITVRNTFTCTVNGVESVGFFANESLASSQRPNLSSCTHNMMVPVLRTSLQKFIDNQSMTLQELLREGFGVDDVYSTACMACERSDGLCQPTTNSSEGHTCLCRDGVHSFICGHPGDSATKKWWIWLVIAVGSSAIVLLCSSCYVVQRKRKVKGKIKKSQKMLYELGGNLKPGTKYSKSNHYKKGEKMNQELHLFSFESIAAATNNFSATNKLGEGGFGPVYKGILSDGQEVAMKRLSRSSGQGLVEFKNEIDLIAKLQHVNLVRLLGCCLQEDEKVLVYEFMANKSLDFFLFDPTKREFLKWPTRFNIIEGIAQGLLYLHKYSRLRIIHRDLKASNILLDDNMTPKISDFGMARVFGLNQSEANTNRVVGTHGYMSPEYALKGIVSTKIDVFSFGVLVLEIVSSKKNNSCYHSEHPLNLIGYAWELWKEGRGVEIMDPTLDDKSCDQNEVMRCINVGLLCVQDHAVDRPSMSDVVSMLTNETMRLPTPEQPAFFIERSTPKVEEICDKSNNNHCTNKLSITLLEAR